MSHYSTIATRLQSTPHLVRALADLGFSHVEVHADAHPLRGWLGDVRPERAHVIVRRVHVGMASNDLGFVRDDNGGLRALISEFDQRTYDAGWLARLTQRYAYHVALDQLRDQGFDVVAEETEADRTIHLTVRRMAP